MKSISQYWLTFVFLWCGYSTDASTDRYSSLIIQADAMYSAGNYQDAAITFERAGFWAGSSELKAIAFLGKAKCLKSMNLYGDAVDVLNRVDHSSICDSVAVQVRLQSALCSYLDGRFSNASSQLEQLFFYVKDTLKTISALPLYALSLNEQGKWSDARKAMKSYVFGRMNDGPHKDSLLAKLNRSYDSTQLPLPKNLRKARTLSSLMPGAGQVYAGYLGEGIASFGLNLAALAFLGINVWSGYYVTTFTVSTMLMQTTYDGGLSRTSKLVEQRNKELRLTYNRSLRQLILAIQESVDSIK